MEVLTRVCTVVCTEPIGHRLVTATTNIGGKRRTTADDEDGENTV
ncbi:MAG: hypothetical protein QOJ71_3314 [Actinomycetota bacterium]|nr:hypothetical protein [Actinomycetota bacterium]